MNDKYKIIFEDDKRVKIKDGLIIYFICKEDNSLIWIENQGKRAANIIIPNVFPSGHCIQRLQGTPDHLGFFGRFGKIIISDDISIDEYAFQFATVQEVVWNNCAVIPKGCFSHSGIRVISNIENVKEIHDGAFSASCIEEIIWPDGCFTIPSHVISYCKHVRKFAAPYVTQVNNYALSEVNLPSFDWPANCRKIPLCCFAYSNIPYIDNLENIEVIEPNAFCGTTFNSLDLSKTSIYYLAPHSLSGLPAACKIIPPYYVSDEDFNRAMANE